MNGPRAAGRQAHAQLAGELGKGTSGKRRRFFVSDLDKPDLLLVGAQRLHDAVDAIAGNPKDGVNSPVDEALYHHIRCCFRHVFFLSFSFFKVLLCRGTILFFVQSPYQRANTRDYLPCLRAFARATIARTYSMWENSNGVLPRKLPVRGWSRS